MFGIKKKWKRVESLPFIVLTQSEIFIDEDICIINILLGNLLSYMPVIHIIGVLIKTAD